MTPRRKQFAQRRKSMGYTQESLAALLRVDRTRPSPPYPALAFDSARTSRRLKRLRDDLAPHRAVAEIRAFVDAYDERFAAA